MTGSCEDETNRSGSSQRAFFTRQLRQLRLASGRLVRGTGVVVGETIRVLDPGILVVEEVRLMDFDICSGDDCEFECVREMSVSV